MSIEFYIFTMLTHFAGYESVHFGLHYAAKNEPTGAAWGLMHFPVMMHYPVKDGNLNLLHLSIPPSRLPLLHETSNDNSGGRYRHKSMAMGY